MDMYFEFDAIFYYVFNLDQAVRFYTDVLGFKLVSRDVVARFDVGGVLFELVPTADRSKLTGSGNARLCLRVPSVAEALEILQQKGVRTSAAEDEHNGILASLWDPDENELCIWEYAHK
jgi:catechol 2,3-dioxygenase-like lactoylglutathione lyase family enzyme